jgi:tetratricopeptide (TPR) repeat protein
MIHTVLVSPAPQVFLYVNGLAETSTTTAMGGMLGLKSRGPDVTTEQKNDILALQIAAHSNQALCFLKTEEFTKARSSCIKALELSPGNVKLLFRRGQAAHALGDLDAAAIDLEAALAQSPSDNMIRAELAAIKVKQRSADKQFAQNFSGMFDSKKAASS